MIQPLITVAKSGDMLQKDEQHIPSHSSSLSLDNLCQILYHLPQITMGGIKICSIHAWFHSNQEILLLHRKRIVITFSFSNEMVVSGPAWKLKTFTRKSRVESCISIIVIIAEQLIYCTWPTRCLFVCGHLPEPQKTFKILRGRTVLPIYSSFFSAVHQLPGFKKYMCNKELAALLRRRTESEKLTRWAVGLPEEMMSFCWCWERSPSWRVENL